MPFGDLLDAVLAAGRVADAPLAIAVLLAHARGTATASRRSSGRLARVRHDGVAAIT